MKKLTLRSLMQMSILAVAATSFVSVKAADWANNEDFKAQAKGILDNAEKAVSDTLDAIKKATKAQEIKDALEKLTLPQDPQAVATIDIDTATSLDPKRIGKEDRKKNWQLRKQLHSVFDKITEISTTINKKTQAMLAPLTQPTMSLKDLKDQEVHTQLSSLKEQTGKFVTIFLIQEIANEDLRHSLKKAPVIRSKYKKALESLDGLIKNINPTPDINPSKE